MTLTLRPAGPSNVHLQSCTCTSKPIPSGDTSATPRKTISQFVNVPLYFACALLCLRFLAPPEE
jgi:hypothetical protein